MQDNLYSIILAGGSGSRLWPLSRDLYPKQLLKINDEKTLIQKTFERLSNVSSQDNILSITNIKHASNVSSQLSEVFENPQVIAEPMAKNTAPAIAFGTYYILKKLVKNGEDPFILAAPVDHLVEDQDAFKSAIEKGIEKAKEDFIVTFGVTPTKADTGFGYIKTDKNLNVTSFEEKPSIEQAQKYIQKENYFWNSGIFLFKASTILNEIKKYQPEIIEIMENSDLLDKQPNIDFHDFNKMPDISIDYAVMEKTSNLSLIPLNCEWSDVGSWEAIYNTSEKDENGNSTTGNVIAVDSKNSYIYSSSKLVATIGISDTVVVETEDAILVCDKKKSQDVKKVFNELKDKEDYTFMAHKTVYRPWGYYTVLNEGDGFLTKVIQVNPGAKLSIQLHHHRSEHWVLLEGKAKVLRGNEEHYLNSGDSIDIAVEETHSLQNPYDTPLKILEVQKGDYISEDDIVRLEDMYGRV